MDTQTKKLLECENCSGQGYHDYYNGTGWHPEYCLNCDGTGYCNQAIEAYRKALRFAIREYEVPTVDLELTRTANLRKKVHLPAMSKGS